LDIEAREMDNDRVKPVMALLLSRGWRLATAESCTGGLIAHWLTLVPGSSAVYAGGVVAYSNDVKTDLLGVPAPLIAEHGAVSAPVAEAMAKGALDRLKADVAIATTGIAGPSGGTLEKPVGLVYMGLAIRQQASRSQKFIFSGNRHEIQIAAGQAALEMVVSAIGEN
jgi:PncC family amidohydrolase